jgi:hypothetical protein
MDFCGRGFKAYNERHVASSTLGAADGDGSRSPDAAVAQ